MKLAWFTALNQKIDAWLAKGVRKEIDQQSEAIALGIVSRFSRGNFRLHQPNLITKQRLEAEVKALGRRG